MALCGTHCLGHPGHQAHVCRGRYDHCRQSRHDGCPYPLSRLHQPVHLLAAPVWRPQLISDNRDNFNKQPRQHPRCRGCCVVWHGGICLDLGMGYSKRISPLRICSVLEMYYLCKRYIEDPKSVLLNFKHQVGQFSLRCSCHMRNVWTGMFQ